MSSKAAKEALAMAKRAAPTAVERRSMTRPASRPISASSISLVAAWLDSDAAASAAAAGEAASGFRSRNPSTASWFPDGLLEHGKRTIEQA
jgi:hypothetical protein